VSAKKIITQGLNLITEERLVIKDNALIMASYSLTIYEQRLIMACIEKAQRKKEPLNSDAIEISLSVNEYAETFGVKMVTAYKALSESSNKLYERSIRMESDGIKRNVRWLQEQAIYAEGRVKLVFSSVISKHISEIVTGRSAYRLEQATQLRSQHSIRFFEYFQMIINRDTQQGTSELSLSQLRELLEIQDSYPRWADLKKKVIEESIKQINKNTSLKVNFEIAEKDGRQVKSVRFNVFESSQLTLSLS
jgi:plasmid replication initiation protein